MVLGRVGSRGFLLEVCRQEGDVGLGVEATAFSREEEEWAVVEVVGEA